MKHTFDLCNLQLNAATSGMMDFQRTTNLCFLLMKCEQVAGDVVEFGCYKGKTAALLGGLTKKRLWLYDSFKGLPAKSSLDITAANFHEGKLKCEKFECDQTLIHAGLENELVIVEKWFDQILPGELPKKISFAHLDGDFHNSIKTSLELVYPRLSQWGVCVIDDYSWPGLPGVKFATDEFLKNKPETLVHPMMLGHQARAHQCWFVKI